jgi:acetyl esterase/lipase
LKPGFLTLEQAKENAASLGVDTSKIFTSGSSAGGQLAAVVTLMARNEGITGIVGQILSMPVTVHPKFAPTDKYEMGSWQQNANASVVNSLRLEWFLDHYMPEPTDDWRMSPLLVPSLKGLPPALVQVAGFDPLRDEGLAYAERMKNEGVDVELHAYQGLPHCFYMLNTHPQTLIYNQRILDFVKKLSG